jgi:cysteinyl-tRNA synthetase
VREEKTLEADLHRISISLKEYAGTNIKEALTPIQARLPQLEVNESIFTNLSKSLQEQFEDAFPGLANKFDSTGLYSEALNSLRKNLAQSDFTGVIGSLSQLSSAATTNIDSLSDFREQLRKEKKWSQADMIRGKLEDIDIFIEDTPHGPVWRRKR